MRSRLSRRSFGLVTASLFAVVASPTEVQAQPQTSTLYAAVIETGSVYDITAGGDFSNSTPFASVAPDLAYGLCLRPDGTLLLASVNGSLGGGVVYDITNGTPTPFASGLNTSVTLSCSGNEVLVGDPITGVIIDISAGGNFSNAAPFASGLFVAGLLRDAANTLWATNLSDQSLGIPPFGVLDITAGGNFVGATPFALSVSGDPFTLAQHGATLLVAEGISGRIIDFGAGGDLSMLPTFATVPTVLGIAANAIDAFAGTSTGTVVDMSAGGDFTNAMAHASGLGGTVYGLTVSSPCGDGLIQAPETCDDQGESATCDADCTAVSCGDGVTNVSAGEACDDQGESATCDVDCSDVSCGDGVTNTSAGEQCDDGNVASGDGCDANCQPEGAGGMGGSTSSGAGGSGGSGGAGGSGDAGGSGGVDAGGGPAATTGGSSSDGDTVVENGCGCRVAGDRRRQTPLAALAMLALAVASLRRRRARPSA
jgi:MYXO-CTERM domain-containing protein